MLAFGRETARLLSKNPSFGDSPLLTASCSFGEQPCGTNKQLQADRILNCGSFVRDGFEFEHLQQWDVRR